MNVGVRELKQHLSEYLDRAARGEVVQVTERGVPKVQIVPVAGSGAMLVGEEEGWLRPAATSAGLQPVRRVAGRASVTQALLDDRGE
jgi:prevent-host-death family protein